MVIFSFTRWMYNKAFIIIRGKVQLQVKSS